ncbi:hypothetical protein [Leucobacter sp. USHLN153]|uniref:hypothetical protein n=1 Tax=Leucobacter sp. USHLN153 TaxID=3081268 RepID=UPI0030192616
MRVWGAVGAALVACAALSGCSAAAGSTVTITYTDADGAEQSVDAQFDDMNCTSTQASATTVSGDLASVTAHFDDSRDNFRGSAWINGESLVSFSADRLDVEREGDKVTVAGDGEVTVTEAIESPADAPSGSGLDTENAEQFEGSISAALVCAE